jgi:recombination protein RecA
MGPLVRPTTPISTGSIYLNSRLVIGGVPNNRITEIWGPASSGKTSLALQIVREYQKMEALRAAAEERPERLAAFIDLEHTTGQDLMEGMGVNVSKLVCAKPDTAEAALDLALAFGRSGEVGLVLFDSVDAAETEADAKRDIGDPTMGTLARALSKAMRKLSKVCDEQTVAYIFINQIRSKLGVMYGNPETTSGGNALPYYASVRIRITSSPSKEKPGVLLMKAVVKKNKFAPAMNSEAEFEFVCGRGTDPELDLVNYLKAAGLLRAAGRSYKLLRNGVEETISTLGLSGSLAYFRTHPEVADELRALPLSTPVTTAAADAAEAYESDAAAENESA